MPDRTFIRCSECSAGYHTTCVNPGAFGFQCVRCAPESLMQANMSLRPFILQDPASAANIEAPTPVGVRFTLPTGDSATPAGEDTPGADAPSEAAVPPSATNKDPPQWVADDICEAFVAGEWRRATIVRVKGVKVTAAYEDPVTKSRRSVLIRRILTRPLSGSSG